MLTVERSLRIQRFLRKAWHEKLESLRFQLSSGVSKIPRLIRLPFGAWWLLRNDNVGEPLKMGSFETAELAFVHRFLRTGVTVLDVGAHHGLYTLLASKRVGKRGQVFSFEPSPRDRRALRLHIILNWCWNVVAQRCALGNENGHAELFVVQGSQTACNSLRPPIVESGTARVRVQIIRLDDWVAEQKIGTVDFIKLDVEGAEMAVLEGATKLLERKPRPVILAEVQDLRTEPWGYKAKEILIHLDARGFKWFRLVAGGELEYLDLSPLRFDGNFVAFPEERLDLARPLLHNGSHAAVS